MMKTLFISVLMLQLTIGITSGQSPAHPETGLPFVQNYPPQTTGGDAQNWQILQDKQGMIYSANNFGILQYDGQSWRLLPSPNHSRMRSLAVDQSGTVYFTARGDFGYLAADSIGNLKTVSLVSRIRKADRKLERIQNILATRRGMYFLSAEKLFRWSNNQIRVWYNETPLRRAFVVRDVVYLIQSDGGLLRMNADSLRLLPGGHKLAPYLVRGIADYPSPSFPKSLKNQETILIATHTAGLFLHDGKTLRPFRTEVDDLLKESRVHHVVRLPDGSYAIATLKAGVIIIDKSGKFLFQIDKRSGLLSNDVKSIYIDREGGMWLALQTGIARVEYASPLSFFNEQIGFTGSLGAISRHQGTLYAGGSQGVFYLASPLKGSNSRHKPTVPASRFVVVSGIKASCWGLLSVDQSLLAATDDGIFQIKGDKAWLVADVHQKKQSARVLTRSKYNRNRVFAGLGGGVAILEWTNGRWLNRGQILSIRKDVYNIIEMNEAELWLETRTDVVIRVKFPGAAFQNPIIDYFDSSGGLPTGQEAHLVRSGSDLFAYTHRKMFRFDEEKNRFVPDTTFGLPFRDGSTYYSFLINGERGRAWMEHEGRSMRVAIRDQSGAYRWLSEPFVKTPHGLIWSFFQDEDGTIWFGGDDVLFRYAPSAGKSSPVDFPAFVRRVATVNSDSTIFGGAPLNEGLSAPTLAYRDNALRFECAAPSYDTPTATQFQYFLEGFDEDWSKWSTETKKDYTNLPEGAYVFRVRARNVYGHESSEAVYAFTILPPWYRTWWAYGLYVLLAGAMLYGIRRYELNRMRLKDQLNMKQFEAAKLKELDQIRSSFFANISHEFRTPLTLILGQIENLRTEIDHPKQTKKLDMAIRHARRLRELINQLLDVAKLEAGKMPFRAQLADIVPFLRKLFASFESLAKQKKLGMRFYAERDIIDVYYEAEKLEKIFINLVSNAIKFTPAGGEISASVRLPQTEGKAKWVEIEVRDSGIGIPEDRLPYIFDRFYQVESGNTRDYEGTGIGLALAKELVELHSGEIRVTSKVGMGTVFKVRLPHGCEHLSEEQIVGSMQPKKDVVSETASEAKSEPVLSTAGDNNAQNSHIILIVEDNPDMRQYIRETLQETYTIAEAVDGAQGFEKAKNLIPNLIISDVMMPRVDGYKMVHTIRSHELTSHIPIIMLTAKAGEDEKLEGLETGVDAYLIKPFSTRELQVRVRKLIEMRQNLLQQRKQPLKITSSDVAVTPVDEQFLERLQKIVEENMEDETFQVGELCLQVGIGERQLYRKLHALLGCTPAAYVRQIRLDRARQLLEKGAGTVSEITFMVGYSNTSAFARAFREAFGQAPSEFRKK